MASDQEERVTRSKTNKSEDENLIQKVVEKILSSKQFLQQLAASVRDALNINVLEEKVTSLEKDMSEVANNLELQEQYSRANNIRIFGMAESASEDTERAVINMCQEKLNIAISSHDIDCSFLVRRVLTGRSS